MTPEELAAAGLRYDVTGDVATVTLSRPELRNAQTPTMWRALAAVGDELPDEVRVVVVRGRARDGQGPGAGGVAALARDDVVAHRAGDRELGRADDVLGGEGVGPVGRVAVVAVVVVVIVAVVAAAGAREGAHVAAGATGQEDSQEREPQRGGMPNQPDRGQRGGDSTGGR